MEIHKLTLPRYTPHPTREPSVTVPAASIPRYTQHSTREPSVTVPAASIPIRTRVQHLLRCMESLLRRFCINPWRVLVANVTSHQKINTEHPIFTACEMLPPNNRDAVRELLILKKNRMTSTTSTDSRSSSTADDDNNDEDDENATNARDSFRHTLSILQQRRRYDGATPLHVAAMMQDDDLVQVLLNAVDVVHYENNNTNNNDTHPSVAVVTATDKDGQTPLHIAALNGSSTIVRMLVETFNNNNNNNNNNAILTTTSRFLDQRTTKGHTAFFLACWRNRFNVAQYLYEQQERSGIDNGSGSNRTKNDFLQRNLTIIDYEGRTLHDRLQEWNQTRIMDWLKDNEREQQATHV